MEPFVGQVIAFAGAFVPVGWAPCNGQVLPIASHTDLFSILGTNFGGDGLTTFGVPDLRAGVAGAEGNAEGTPSRPTVRFIVDLEASHLQIVLFAGPFVPMGWTPCDGRLLPVASHRKLFSTVGARFGGDGRSTFALPDLRGRVALYTEGDDAMGMTPRPGNVGFLIALEGSYPHRE